MPVQSKAWASIGQAQNPKETIMTPVQKSLIARAAKIGNNVLVTKLALLAQHQGNNQSIYLDNAYHDVSKYKSQNTLWDCLAALSKQGFYKPLDGQHWGQII